MNAHTCSRAKRRLASVALLLGGAMLALAEAGAAAPVSTAAGADAQLTSVLQQLAQVQAQLARLTEENRALRAHEAQIDRELAHLSAMQSAAPGGASAPAAPGAQPRAPSTAATAPPPASDSALPAGSAQPAPGASVATSVGALSPNLRLWGYGEVYYTHPVADRAQTRMDLARAVFGIGYGFDERTEFNSEYELEHAVSSASDVGEFEVEQFYVDRRLGEAVTARAGLFLMPFGFLNEHHEPTNFYGVQRNFVETLIIPSTWREGGVNLHGDTAGGFAWNAGVTTGFDLSKWDFAPRFPPYRSALELEDSGIAPLQAAHQELALANARALSSYAALGYYGLPGLALGAAISSGKAVAPGAGDPRVTLWEAHARWAPRRWELSALYARGAISDLAAANTLHPAATNPIPSSFYGYYLQGAYRLWEHGEYRLAPFARFERYNLGARFAGSAGPAIPPGAVPLSASPGDLGFWPEDRDRVWTAGANFFLGPHLVLKGDYQWFQENVGFRRFDLGLGVAF
jgi:Phosphate-selective porin O and P